MEIMENNILTVDQVAEILELHPKTIRRFIREGKLKATKIGKQWRVTGDCLADFMGSKDTNIQADNQKISESLTNTDGNDNKPKIQVSAVVDIIVEDQNEAIRITNTLFAVMNCKDPSYGNARCDHIFYKNELKARYILWGSPQFITDILGCISAIIENKS
jgi:excisionase family DNA binding protein